MGSKFESVVGALVDILEGAKKVCDDRKKRQVLGQDVITHLLRAYPDVYRKVFYQ